jgi:outer membrane protein TolC
VARNRRVGSLILGILCVLAACGGAPAGSPGEQPSAYGQFDFGTCVRYALMHSPIFLENRIDIQLQATDLKDAHSEVLPSFQLLTRYYLARPANSSNNNSGNNSGNSNKNRFSVQFLIQDWNPYAALVKVKAYGILMDIAKISHEASIAENVANLAKLFFKVDVLDHVIKARRQLIALHRDKVNYGKSKNSQGTIDPLEVRNWELTLRAEVLKLQEAERDRQDALLKMKMIMGYYPDFFLPLDTRGAVNQILSGFTGDLVTFGEIQGSNLKMQMLAKKEQAQSVAVTGAYLLILPKPMLVIENVQNQVDRTSGFNMALGTSYPIWDGFKGVREIRRQKLKAEKARLDREKYSLRMYGEFKAVRNALDGSRSKAGLQSEQARLAELNEERAFLRYKSGDLPYEQYMDRRIEKVLAHMASLTSQQERVVALIDLATLAGGLNKYNARIRY